MRKVIFALIITSITSIIFLSGCGGDGMEATGLFNIKTPTPTQSTNLSFPKIINTPIIQSNEGVNISGKVYDCTFKKPIPFAPIIFGGKITQADNKGNYTVKNIAGNMKVIVFADGYEELQTTTTNLDLSSKRKDFYLKKKEDRYND